MTSNVSRRWFGRGLKFGAYKHALIVDFALAGYGLLHAKVIVIDRRQAIVGSANLTAGGLGKNHEIAVLVEGEVAWEIASLIDRMVGRTNREPKTLGTG
ncbi:MAG TPA: phospholipase D-like domain-containing protein [Chthonomonadales bacterium]|nr:phospholipase D-like domain-containing protein [Chthonomonadales bacterium]